MKKDLPGVSNAWILLLTYSLLFILLVISRNQQFWNQRKASASLVKAVSAANERQVVFTDLYNQNLKQEIRVLKLGYLLNGNSEINALILPLIGYDSLFEKSEKLLASAEEQQLFNKLKVVSDTKDEYLKKLLHQIQNGNNDKLERKLNVEPDVFFEQFREVSNRLLQTIKANDKKNIKKIGANIIRINNINIWLSIALVILLISLGYNLITIVRKGNSTRSALKESESRFRSFFNLAPIPMWLIDPVTNKFLSVNKAALEHYGYSEEEFSKMTIFDIRKAENMVKEYEAVKMIKEGTIGMLENKTGKFNCCHSKKAGDKIDVEIYTSPIVIKHKTYILTIVIDVTDRNHFENKITKAIIKTQEDERYEIGSELHDNVCQILASAKMGLSIIRKSLEPPVTEPFDQSFHAIILAMQEIRNLSHRLAPAFFDNTRLEEAIAGLLNTFNIGNKYNITLDFDKDSQSILLDKEIQLNLYRVLQEQLRNIIKHSGCSDIEVSVFVHKNLLHMRIADNGVGFEVSEIKKGIGLSNMKRRAELFSGKFYLNTATGKGCEIMIIIPLTGHVL
jgi:PAS domain S-box-containing protein